MWTPFSKTLTHLQAAEEGSSKRLAVVVVALMIVLGGWLVVSRTTVYAVSEEGRLLAAGAASPVQTPIAGVVAENLVLLGTDVQAGDVLVRLDSSAETLRRAEEQARVEGLQLAAESLALVIEAERNLAAASVKANATRVSSAATRAQVAADVAALSRQQDAAMSRLRDAALVSGLDALKTAEELIRQRGQVKITSADTVQASADLDRVRREADVRLYSLERELTELRARSTASRAAIATLDWEIARRTLRAAIAGKVADATVLPRGAAVSPGETIATIVPQAPLKWVAYFSPREAVGRVQVGQRARIRLDAFPWTAYGALDAIVTGVGSEPREQRIRVELALTRDNPGIHLSHGMTGTTDIEVEEMSPLRLFLRLSGQRIQGAPSPVTSTAPSSSSAL
jgi:membrane fusion protein (multidrug efflux system)